MSPVEAVLIGAIALGFATFAAVILYVRHMHTTYLLSTLMNEKTKYKPERIMKWCTVGMVLAIATAGCLVAWLFLTVDIV